MTKILVSACLLGDNCKYNGGNNYHKKIGDYLKDKDYVKACPECLGGLSTPRCPSEIIQDKVFNREGVDVTKEFQKGAYRTLDIIKKEKISVAILKSKSPSCGYGLIYDGTFSNKLIAGNGITADLLVQNGIKVISSDEF